MKLQPHTPSQLPHQQKENSSQNFTLNVDDYTHTLIDSASSTSAVKKGDFRNNVTYLIDENIETLGANDRVIGNFAVDVPGTTYSSKCSLKFS